MNETEFSNNQNTEGQAAPSQARSVQIGPIVGSIIVVILLIFGGLYFIGKKVSEEGFLAPTPEAIESAPDSALENLQNQATSDEVGAISEDLDATVLDDLDAELQNIESEL